MRGGDILFLGTVFPDPHSRLGRGNLPREGIHHTQTDAVNRNTVRECPLQDELESRVFRESVCTAYFEGSFEFEEDGLIDENFSSLCAEESDFVFCQLDLFSWSTPSD